MPGVLSEVRRQHQRLPVPLRSVPAIWIAAAAGFGSLAVAPPSLIRVVIEAHAGTGRKH